MVWRGKETPISDRTKRIQVWNEDDELIYDRTGDTDEVLNPLVRWERDGDNGTERGA